MFFQKSKKKAARQEVDAATGPLAADDPFLWLEDVEGEKALDWVRGQNDRSLHELQNDSRFEAFHREALSIYTNEERIAAPSLLGNEVRNFWQDEKHTRGLWRRAPLESYLAGSPGWETIIDFDALAEADRENWVFAGGTALQPASDRVMVTLSRGGSDAAVRREFLVSQKCFVENGFVLPEGKGSVAWLDEDTLYVALAPTNGDPESATASGYPRTVKRVRRGEALETAETVFEGKQSDIGVWPASIVRAEATYTFITRAVTFFESEHYLIDANGKPALLPLPLKSEVDGVIEGAVIVSLQEPWRYRGADFEAGDLIAYDLKKNKANLVFRPNDQQAVSGVAVGENALFVQILDNIIGRILKIEPKRGKWRETAIDLPGAGQVSLGGVNREGDDFFLYYDSPTEPSTLYYASANGALHQVKQTPIFFDADGVVMEQRRARSRDGAEVPYFVIGRKDIIEKGSAPVIQYGYGGFEVPSTPGYSGVIGKLWLERGGVFVIANIRGGGEFGPRWHQAALKEKRQTGFDDFFAVSEDMIRSGLTSPEKLGAYGGSNGGLLMGVALTQRPDLYGGLAIGVPLLDMLRYTKLLAGASWVGEYGDPDVPEERSVLEAYSPYHRLQETARYPVPFFFTSTKDDRVHPGHARKMAARMADMGHDFLYYENIEGGHGAAANLKQAAFRASLQYVYFWRALERADELEGD